MTLPLKTPAVPIATERWICRQLQCLDLLCGVTTAEERRDRIRARIVSLGVADGTAGHRDGQPETWGQLFERIYREPVGEAL